MMADSKTTPVGESAGRVQLWETAGPETAVWGHSSPHAIQSAHVSDGVREMSVQQHEMPQ